MKYTAWTGERWAVVYAFSGIIDGREYLITSYLLQRRHWFAKWRIHSTKSKLFAVAGDLFTDCPVTPGDTWQRRGNIIKRWNITISSAKPPMDVLK